MLDELGHVPEHHHECVDKYRNGDEQIGREDVPGPRLQRRQFLPLESLRPEATDEGNGLREQIGYAGEVGKQPVAVEPYERNELTQRFDVEQQRGGQEKAVAREGSHTNEGGRKNEMKVDAP